MLTVESDTSVAELSVMFVFSVSVTVLSVSVPLEELPLFVDSVLSLSDGFVGPDWVKSSLVLLETSNLVVELMSSEVWVVFSFLPSFVRSVVDSVPPVPL